MANTDEFGKRRVTSWRMTEDTVRQFAHVYKDAVKVEGSLEIEARGLDQRLATLAAVIAGRRVEVLLGGVPPAYRFMAMPDQLSRSARAFVVPSSRRLRPLSTI